MASTKTMAVPFLTNIPTHLAAATSVTIGGFIFGDAVGGMSGGVAGAIAGAVVGLVGAMLTAMLTMRKQNTDGAIAIDRERDAILERVNQVHINEIANLNTHHARERNLATHEKDFLQRQIVYHEQLELVTRKRLHAMVSEVQRCIVHISVIEQKAGLDLPPFKANTFDEIVAMYPLPPAVLNTPNPLS